MPTGKEYSNGDADQARAGLVPSRARRLGALVLLCVVALTISVARWRTPSHLRRDSTIRAALVDANGARIVDFFKGSWINPSLIGGRPLPGPQLCSARRLSVWGRLEHFFGLARTVRAQSNCLGCFNSLFPYACPEGDPRCSGGSFYVPDGGGYPDEGNYSNGYACGSSCGIPNYALCLNTPNCPS
jgi:hypothetical protein